MWSLLLIGSLVMSGCFETEKGEPYYGQTVVPRAQEFRWSDGGLPRVFDPALAAAPPDTDAVRAMFEGLTDYDPRSLTPVSAVATRWESSADGRQWTFYLRRDARWSNGDPVTAKDFVRSWQRTLRLGDRAPHARLLENIEGAQSAVALVTDPSLPPPLAAESAATTETARQKESPTAQSTATPQAQEKPPTPRAIPASPAASPSVPPPVFGARAVDDYVLTVRLRRPDKNFPALAAHPVFRPVHDVKRDTEATDDAEAEDNNVDTVAATIISNGAFRLSTRAKDSVVLERASNYWDASKVALERVRFVAASDAESALAAYRKGEVDVVTNAPFEPLALKLLAPFEDFRRGTYGALTYYSFNLKRAPFNDRRVREALAIALDRDRLSADTMKGATEPAKKFLPALAGQQSAKPNPPTHTEPDAQAKPDTTVERDATEKNASTREPEKTDVEGGEPVERDEAGGRGSETASRNGQNGQSSDAEGAMDERAHGNVSRAANAGETEARANQETKARDESAPVAAERFTPLEQDVERARSLLAEAGFAGGEGFPRIRLLVNRNDQHRIMAQAVAAMWRSVLGVETEIVLRDWEEYEAALWTGDYDIARRGMVMQTTDEESNILSMFAREQEAQAASAQSVDVPHPDSSPTPAASATDNGAGRQPTPATAPLAPTVLTQAQALGELPGFPVYFASSYALVKPYVAGFETNLLDAPSLKHVRINTEWKPAQESRVIHLSGGE